MCSVMTDQLELLHSTVKQPGMSSDVCQDSHQDYKHHIHQGRSVLGWHTNNCTLVDHLQQDHKQLVSPTVKIICTETPLNTDAVSDYIIKVKV